MKLASARLVTKDVSVLAEFYRELLKVEPIGSDCYVELATTSGTVAISSKRSVDIFNAAAAEPAANRSVILDFEVEDVDRERDRLHDLIGQFVSEPTDQPWGTRSMLFRDPDGNLINFFSKVSDRAPMPARLLKRINSGAR
ncbi:MAG: VOC family protein [Acidobacteria bacterium]|nr:VOC family protein [Acidobacteriota bacterium]